MAKTTLYKKDAKQAIRFWEIESDSEGFNVTYGHLGGAKQAEYTEVPFGLASRTREQQIASQFQSKINKQLQRGYKTSISEAEEQVGGGLNEAGLPRPMLATPEKDVEDDVSGWMHQPKLNGHRCITKHYDGEVSSCSRNGKAITTVTEIFDEIRAKFAGNDLILDGELYHHGTSLQTIGSWVKKRQPETSDLTYWIYDIVDPSMTFRERNAFLVSFFGSMEAQHDQRLVYCPTSRGIENKTELLRFYRSLGYEGGIGRNPDGYYETGKRSKNLVKIKHLEDDEFPVLGLKPSKNGWAIADCLAKNGKIFSVTCPGTEGEKIYAMNNPHLFEGRMLQVQYAELTDDGIPFHPVATMWRNKDDE